MLPFELLAMLEVVKTYYFSIADAALARQMATRGRAEALQFCGRQFGRAGLHAAL